MCIFVENFHVNNLVLEISYAFNFCVLIYGMCMACIYGGMSFFTNIIHSISYG